MWWIELKSVVGAVLLWGLLIGFNYVLWRVIIQDLVEWVRDRKKR